VVSRELIGHIFEPFFTTWQKPGRGFGLAVVKSIVDEHGGAIAVSTEENAGTRFTVHFRLRRCARPGRGRMTGQSKKKLLVLDDDAGVVDFLCESLTDRGFDVTGLTLPRRRCFDQE